MSEMIVKFLLFCSLMLVMYGVIAPFARADQITTRCCPLHEVRENKIYSIKVDNSGKYHFIYFGETKK